MNGWTVVVAFVTFVIGFCLGCSMSGDMPDRESARPMDDWDER